jgi:hypothetical protein
MDKFQKLTATWIRVMSWAPKLGWQYTPLQANVKCSPATRHGCAWGERRCSSYSFTTSALYGVSGQHHAPAALCPRGKDPLYPLDRRLGAAGQCSPNKVEILYLYLLFLRLFSTFHDLICDLSTRCVTFMLKSLCPFFLSACQPFLALAWHVTGLRRI